MQLIDHIFIVLLLLAQPVNGAISFTRFVRKVHAGTAPARLRLIRDTLILEWSALAVLVIAWLVLDRSFADLGVVPPGGTGFLVGGVVVVILVVFLWYQVRAVLGLTPEEKARQVRALGELVHFLPHTEREYRAFAGLSISAGIVEEIVYRGFAIWYFSQVMPLWAAVVVASVMFGLGHSYQGPAGILKTGLVGIGFGTLYVFSGSIWLPILAHALFDIMQGKAIFELLRDRANT